MRIITQGMSRIVFVYKDSAIKVPWINFFKIITCFIKYKKEGIANEKIQRFHKNKILAIFPYFLYILSANRREYLYFKKNCNEKSLLPITKGLLFGYIIIQPKGEVLKEENPRWNNLLLKLVKIGIKNIDLLKSENFCLFNNEIKLLDYGSDLTQETLETMGFEIIYE